MGVLQKETKSGFTVVNNTILHDKNLTAKLRGLLITLLSLPPYWDFKITGLQAILPDGRSSIAAGLRDLEKFGYLKRTMVRDAKTGIIVDTVYTIYDKPHLDEETEENDGQASCGDDNDSSDGGVHNNEETQINEVAACNTTDEPPREKYAQNPRVENQQNPCDYPEAENQHTENRSLQQVKTNRLSINIYNTKGFKKDEYIYPSIYQPTQSDSKDGLIDGMSLYDSYREMIKCNISYDDLLSTHSDKACLINELVEIMTEILTVSRGSYTISGVNYPSAIIKARMMKLERKHIDYVLASLEKNTSKVRNIKAYLITTLFNSYTTAENYNQMFTNSAANKKYCHPDGMTVKPNTFNSYEQRDYEEEELENIIKAKQSKCFAKII